MSALLGTNSPAAIIAIAAPLELGRWETIAAPSTQNVKADPSPIWERSHILYLNHIFRFNSTVLISKEELGILGANPLLRPLLGILKSCI
ncbi:hypothetical protein DO97_06295 [Neosynechococcus sphagnicola sy1]|uniref:Uncharacterized protein n=1 Tax=Neosynechococcus sphagnicola sy1 TaxID=1497020 RepID=A0A098TNV3_9CYAN|nr:hypothetical protein DO97_06295 [Neosynechococcus sphagnicola sy1]